MISDNCKISANESGYSKSHSHLKGLSDINDLLYYFNI